MSNIEKIRQEIERRLKYTHDWLRGDEKRHPKQTAISKNYYKMKGDERTLDALLSFIDSLPEEKPSEDFPTSDGEMMSGLAERAFIAGAKWRESQAPLPEDSVAFNNGVKEGKRLLMEEAVEGEVCESEHGLRDIVLQMEPFQKVMKGFKEGDKVKIIIVKQDAARRE